MKKIRSRLTVRILLAVVAFALILAEPAALSAQKRKPFPSPSTNPSSPNSTTDAKPSLRSVEQASLEMNILMSRRTLIADLERQRRRATVQLAENLEQLEQINTTKLVPLSTTTPHDYKNLAQASAEIKALAIRIKFYSPFVLVDRTGEKVRYESDASQLAAMLPQLSRTVARFVDNPVFRISAPNDEELRSAAAHDLEGIIKLSDAINKITKRLSKTLVASR